MKKITENLNDLMTFRVSEIINFLRPVTPHKFIEKQQIYVDVFSKYRNTIFSVTSKGKQDEEYEKRKFPIVGGEYTGAYYEVWVPNSPQTLYLDRAYFHLYKLEETLDDIVDNEYIYLHCDPNESDTTHYPYKLTPHLHILQHDISLTHAHLAVHLYKQEEILESRETITNGISSALQMLSSQFFH